MTAERVTLSHLRRLGYCMHGVRGWCVRHGFDYNTLRTEGLPAEELEATGDHFAAEAARLARADDGQQ